MRSGRCIYVSSPIPGSQNDQYLWNLSGLRAQFVGKTFGIVGDKMFMFNRKKDKTKIIGFAPAKKNGNTSANDNLDDNLTEKNKRIGGVRARIERYFSRLKEWRVFKGVNRMHSADLWKSFDFSRIVIAIASLIEWLRRRNVTKK